MVRGYTTQALEIDYTSVETEDFYSLCFAGQTGHGVCEEATPPRIVTSLRGINPTFLEGDQSALDVIAVSCGGWHTAVVSGSGDVYSFGWARDGQIGIKRVSPLYS